jgi:hypothetical protein
LIFRERGIGDSIRNILTWRVRCTPWVEGDMSEKVDPAEIAYLADRAVNELIEDAKSGRLDQNRELAEVIMGCIRNTANASLEHLKWLLDQRALERPDLENKHPDFREPNQG